METIWLSLSVHGDDGSYSTRQTNLVSVNYWIAIEIYGQSICGGMVQSITFADARY